MSLTKKWVQFVAACVAVTANVSCKTDQALPNDELQGEVRQELRTLEQDLRAATDRVSELSRARPGVGAPEGASAGEGFALDVRDRDQKAFVEARLRYVGKTPENSPNLFARLGRQSAAAPTAIQDGGLVQDCDNPLSVKQVPNTTNRWEARIITSCFSGADYSYVDVFWWNKDTGNIIAYDFREDFENPTDLTLEIEATADQIGTVIQVDSMAINARGAEDYYGFNDVVQERPDTLSQLDSVFHPSDVNNDQVVTTCLDRGGADCDYQFMGTGGDIRFPVSMGFRFPGTVQSIVSAVGQVHMTNTGGVCKTANLAPYTTFAGGAVTVNTGGPVSFGQRCVNNQVAVRFWVNVVAKTTRGTYSMFWANDREDDPKRFAMQFRWSCLAEGSKIVMADGTQKPIEKVKLGERVRSGGRWLTVVDVTSGYESAPIVELESDNGASLLVTQGHPFFGPDGKPLRADALEVGSAIKTSKGFAKVTKLNRRPYAGKVYNLKLGTEEQIGGLDVGSINMFANGFSVGDSRSQWALEMLRQQKPAGAPVPDEWKQDLLMSAPRGPALERAPG